MQRDFVYLKDVLESAKAILKYTAGRTYEDFINDEYFKDAVLRRVIVIGEAVRRVSHQFADEHPNVPWAAIASMRNAVVHDYDGIDDQIVWDTIFKDIPSLISIIQEIFIQEGLGDHI